MNLFLDLDNCPSRNKRVFNTKAAKTDSTVIKEPNNIMVILEHYKVK